MNTETTAKTARPSRGQSARGRGGVLRGIAVVLALAFALGAVAACGKKGSPMPPDDSRKGEYPRTYPDPSTY